MNDLTQPADSVPALRARLQAQRAEAIVAFRTHLRPDTLLTALRRVVDNALVDLLQILPLPPGAALGAVGGYGRGELYPFSDVDVLVLLAREPSPDDETLIASLVTALWDMGIEPGYSVRTIAQCV